MVPTPTILIWIMILGVLKLTRKFGPYNSIIPFFIIEIVAKMTFFQLKVGFFDYSRRLGGWMVRKEVKARHHIWTIGYAYFELISK
jgi:hypothetical protein